MYKGMNLQKVALLLALIFVATAAAAVFIFFAEYGFDFDPEVVFDIKGSIKVDEEKTEALQGLETISVETTSDDIRIIPADSNEVKVHFHGSYKSSSPDFKPVLTVERSGRVLEIKVKYTLNTAFSFNSNLKLDVHIPGQYAGKLETISTSGEVTAKGFTLDSFTSKTTSGDLVVTELTAKTADLQSTSGEISVEGAPGDVRAESSSGDVALKYAEFSNTIDIRTSSGEVEIALPENAGFELDYDSSSGEAVCDFPITVTAGGSEGKKLKGTVGSGKAEIKVTSASGSLRIRK